MTDRIVDFYGPGSRITALLRFDGPPFGIRVTHRLRGLSSRLGAVLHGGFLWIALAAQSGVGQTSATDLLLHDTDPAIRGAYLFQSAGCPVCHTDIVRGGPHLAGGRTLYTDYGTLFVPNISSDPDFGIGAWTEADFFRAMRDGRRRDGTALLPICPYPSYTRMTDRDLQDLWTHLSAQPPVPQPNRPHQLDAVAGTRLATAAWQTLFLEKGPVPDAPDRSTLWNRGRYLTLGVARCNACHTPRGWFGEPDHARELAGTIDGPIGDRPPNLTPHRWALGPWSEGDIYYYLAFGIRPDGTFTDGLMEEVITHSTAHLTPVDRRAIVMFLKLLPPVN